MEILVCLFITFLIMRAHHAVKSEWQHSRDTHAADLSREHPDWSPGRIRRNARRRARGDWLTEIGEGFPTLRQTLAEDRVLAQAVRHEKLAAGEERIGKLRDRVAAAIERREALRRSGQAEPAPHVTPEPEDAAVEPGSGTGDGPEAKPGRHAKPEPGPEPAAEPEGPESSVVHHDHTYTLPGQCPQCHGPGVGIPLVRGDHVKEVRAPDGTLLGEDGKVVSADDKTVAVELPNGLRVTGPNAAVPVAHRNGDSPDPPPPDAPIDDAVTGADREFTDWPEDNWPDEESIPNPPSDETTDDTTEKETEGDTMTTDFESADTPYQGIQNALDAYAQHAAAVAKEAGDDLAAHTALTGFDRDPQFMAGLARIQDNANALVAEVGSVKAGLIARHNAAEEYHGTGQDADAIAFRPA